MTSRLKHRWVATGLIWVIVLILTGWNIYRINMVQTDRHRLATMQMDQRFLKANQATIQDVRLHQSRLMHFVTSADLGFLVVENNLKRLSWNFGLQTLSVKTDSTHPSSNRMLITIVAYGSVPAVASWITAVEEAYPYLVVKRMDLTYESAKHAGRLQATFDYHFSLSEAGPVS